MRPLTWSERQTLESDRLNAEYRAIVNGSMILDDDLIVQPPKMWLTGFSGDRKTRPMDGMIYRRVVCEGRAK
jgi:hypothetical protein